MLDEIKKETGCRKFDVKKSICSICVEELRYWRSGRDLHLRPAHKLLVHGDKKFFPWQALASSDEHAAPICQIWSRRDDYESYESWRIWSDELKVQDLDWKNAPRD